MHPVLLRIGSLPINTYGLMLAVSFLLGLWLGARRAAVLGIPRGRIYDLGVWVMIAAIVGSRLFYVLTHMQDFTPPQGSLWDAVAFWNGLYGLSMLGGVVLAMAVGFTLIALWRMPVWKLADATIPSFALGIFITRIGCFLNGCCFGTGTSCGLGVVFPEGSMPHAVFGSHPVHPTQLYSSLGGLVILVILLLADRRRHFPGFVFCLFLGLYGVTRFGLEEFRHFDHEPHMMLGYSEVAGRAGITDNQLISLVILAAGLLLGTWLYLGRSRGSSASS